MNTTTNTKVNTNITSEENKAHENYEDYIDAHFELAIKALRRNHFKSSMKYFRESISRGNKRAYMYCNLLRRYEDIMLARDIILCAEKRI